VKEDGDKAAVKSEFHRLITALRKSAGILSRINEEGMQYQIGNSE
jgi:hypothetical protein